MKLGDKSHLIKDIRDNYQDKLVYTTLSVSLHVKLWKTRLYKLAPLGLISSNKKFYLSLVFY